MGYYCAVPAVPIPRAYINPPPSTEEVLDILILILELEERVVHVVCTQTSYN